MTLLKRRFLYSLFIILFLILVPLISFYASGYDFNIQNGQLSRTGILIIETEPRGATIDLGTKKKFNWLYNFLYENKELTTPIKLRNVLPDEYDITLKNDGYFDYHRNIKVESGQTLFLDDILLVKNSNPELVVDQNVISTKISPDKKKLAVITKNNIVIIDMDNGQQKTIAHQQKTIDSDTELLWSPSNKKLIVAAGDYAVYNVETTRQEITVKKYLTRRIDSVVWDSFSDNILYVQSAGLVYQLNIIKPNPLLLVGSRIKNDFFVKDDNLYSIETINNSTHIIIRNIENQNAVKNISIPALNDYKFFTNDSKLVYLHDQKYSLLYVIDPFSVLPITSFINNVRDFSVINDNNIIFWNDFEIWLHQDNNKTLITRISDKIEGAVLRPSNNHVMYNTAKNIKLIELEDNAYVGSQTILGWRDTSTLFLSSNNKFIYFISPLNKEYGLYRLEI